MQREFVSNNDKAFILKALQEEMRIDGRKLYDFRKVKFEFTLDDSTCTVTLGSTRVMTAVLATLEAPYPDRPNEGSLRFNVELSAMASPAIDLGWGGMRGEEATELARLVERGLRQSRAIDQEALCVLAGRKVWSLRVDTHVLDHSGNLVDACCLSALGALLAFRKPEVSVGGVNNCEVVVHPPEVKEPLPLTIHHLPIAVTFGLFEDGNTLVIDPDLKEEATMEGSATIIVNPNKEVCAVHKAGGVGITSSQLFRCVRLASAKAEELASGLKAALELHEVRRVQARIRRHVAATPAAPPGPVTSTAGVAVKEEAGPASASGAATEKLAAELGIDMSEDDVGTSDSDEDEQVERDQGATRAAGAAASSSGPPSPAAKAQARDGASQQAAQKPKLKATSQAAAAAAPKSAAQAQQGKKKSGIAGGGKRSPEVKYDELEAIAAVIAGAGGSTGGNAKPEAEAEVLSLADAVKKTPSKKR